jgi:hypothetical protein
LLAAIDNTTGSLTEPLLEAMIRTWLRGSATDREHQKDWSVSHMLWLDDNLHDLLARLERAKGITSEQARAQLERLRPLRNRIVHGGYATESSTSLREMLRSLIASLARKQQSTPADAAWLTVTHPSEDHLDTLFLSDHPFPDQERGLLAL